MIVNRSTYLRMPGISERAENSKVNGTITMAREKLRRLQLPSETEDLMIKTTLLALP